MMARMMELHCSHIDSNLTWYIVALRWFNFFHKKIFLSIQYIPIFLFSMSIFFGLIFDLLLYYFTTSPALDNN